jgi:hypothetical protein
MTTKEKIWEILEGVKTWSAIVEEDPNDPEQCIITFPEDLLERVEWVEGDTISWDIQEDRSVILSKVK